MTRCSTRLGSAWLIATVALGATGCGGDEQPGPETTTPGCTEVAGACVGVPSEAVCGSNTCTDGVGCTNVLTAASDAELSAAIAQAGAGDCIALAPGSYARADLPGGVSLLGQSADTVTVAGVVLGDGDGATVRGLTVDGSLEVGTATGVRVTAARVRGGRVGVTAGAAVELDQVELLDAPGYGLFGEAASSIALRDSIIKGAAHGGLHVQCGLGAGGPDDPCDCVAKSQVTLERVLLRHNGGVAAAFIGSAATLQTVDIDEIQRGPSFKPGGGVSASACSSLRADDTRITGTLADNGHGVDNPQGYGILLDSSSADIGTGGGDQGIIVVDTMPGVWLNAIGAPAQEPDQQVRLADATLQSCYGAALGFDGAAKGIIVVDTKVASTTIGTMPGEPGFPDAHVGLGVVWKGGAAASIDGLSLSGSADRGMLIDGEVGAGSSLAHITLSGGDEVSGILQQQLAPDSAPEATPATDGSMGTIETTTDKVSEVPVGPTAPAPQ